MGGSATLDMVATVAKLEPQTLAKPAQATTVAIASPPLRWPKKAFAAPYKSSDKRAAAIKPPMRTNSGMTDNSSFSTVEKAS